MKKVTLIIVLFTLVGGVYGQQKIGNNPTSLNANAVLELESTNKGLLIPRIALTSTSSASPLSAFVAGMMVYNTATVGDVTPGFYVSTGSSWSKIDNQTSTTLYNGNGTLSGNRTVTQGTNTLAFTSTATNGFSVDGTTFSVDAANNRIGIGTATPTQTLDVVGTARFDGGALIQSFTNGTWINLPTTGPSGIGSGGSGANAWIGYAQANGQWFNDAAAGDIAYRNTTGKLLWGNNSTAAAMAMSNDRLGIGILSPAEKLHVVGNIRSSSLAGTGSRMVVADANGTMSTTSLPSSYTGSTSVTLNGSSFERAALTGDVTAAANSNATTIAANAVTSAKILDGTVATADIADNAITKNKLENNIAIPGTANMTLPGGTTAERPAAPSAGMIRYNSTLGKTEVYQGGTWVSIDASTYTASNGLTMSSNNVKLGGTLTDASTSVNLGTNKFNFASSASSGAGHFEVDGSTFSIDAALNRVGVGTSTPSTTLDVVGTFKVSGVSNLATTALNSNPLYLRSDANHGLTYNGTADGPRLYGFGGGLLGTQNGTNALFWNSSGNVGIGNSSPSEKLDVTGNVRFSGALMPNNSAGTAGQVLTSAGAGAVPTWSTPSSATNMYNTDGSLTGSRTISQGTNNLAFTSAASTGTSHFTVDGTTLNVDAVNNRIGVGIASPVDQLHLQAQGGRKIVISNNGGITNNEDIGGITWRDGDGTGTLMGNIVMQGNSGSTGDGSSRMVIGTRSNDNATILVETMSIHSNGNVGLGVIAPSEKLHVVGNIRSSSLAGSGSRMVVADANGVMSTTAIPTSTTYTGSTSVTLNGTSFERAALTGDVTATANSNATTIANDAVTYAKMQNVSTNNRLLGRATTGAGDMEEITLGTGLSFSGTTLNAATGNTLYTADGTLGGNRTVSQGNNTLAFTSTATTGTSHFTVDGSTLNVDANNNRVGIGTSSPASRLDVDGGLAIRGTNSVTSQGLHLQWNKVCCDGASYILNNKGGGSGGIRFGNVSNTDVLTEWGRFGSGGNFGIGISSDPEEKLHIGVSGSTAVKLGAHGNANGALFFGAGGTSGVVNWIDFYNATGTKRGNIFFDQTNGFVINNTGSNTNIGGASGGRLGVNTVSPTSTLDVDGGILARSNNSVSNQGAHLQWNRSGTDGESWILNQKGGGGANAGIRFGSVTTSNATTEWARFLDNGNFGIGNTNPTGKLDVSGGKIKMDVGQTLTIHATDNFTYDSKSMSHYGIGWFSDSWNNGGPTAWFSSYGGLKFFTNGNLSMTVNGSGTCQNGSGSWSAFSDARIKTVKSEFKDGLDVIKQINPVRFVYNENAPFKSKDVQIGIVAQDLEKVAPYMVTKSNNGEIEDLREVNSQAYVFLLINAVKEQQAQIEEMKKEIEQLKKDKK